jgi:choline transport protein
MWSFSRDNGFPFSSQLSKVADAPFAVPLYSHLFSCFWIAMLGLLYLGSSTAFNSLVTGCILMQYISYLIPVTLLMLNKRYIPRPGPFYLGKWGWLANGVLVTWSIFTLVFYSFPYIMPVTRSNMSMFPRFPSPTLGFYSDEKG